MFKKVHHSHSFYEKKRLLKAARKVSAGLYRNLKSSRVDGEEFLHLARHGITTVLHRKYLYFQHYLSELQKRGIDVFSAEVDLLKVPYKIKSVQVYYAEEDIKYLLNLFKKISKEFHVVVHHHFRGKK